MDHITVAADVSCSRTTTTSDPDGYLTVTVNDELSASRIVQLRIPHAEFSKLITGGNITVRADAFPAFSGRWGKKMVTHSVKVPDKHATTTEQAQAWADAYAQDNGWDSADVRRTREASLRVTLRRWETPDDGEECSPACFDDCDGSPEDSHIPRAAYDAGQR